MTDNIWKVIEEKYDEHKTSEDVLKSVCDYYRSQGVLVTDTFTKNTKQKIMEYDAYQEGFLIHHASEL